MPGCWAPAVHQCDLARLGRGASGGETPARAAEAEALQALTVAVHRVRHEAAGTRLEGASFSPASFFHERVGTPFSLRTPDGQSRRQARRLLCSFQRCFVCGEMGAAITCGEKGCDRSFHLPCASRGECVTQYFGLYRSFCWEHRPEQALKAKPGQNSTCIVCLGPVEDKKSYHTMACPACQQAWFHRSCIQKQAIHAGVCFCCLHCRNQDRFVMEMLAMGIRISKRQPSWESGQALGPVYQRHRRCNASKCLCPGGREQAEEEGPWQVLLCSSCAAKGTHRRCLYSSNSAITWECDCCAGLGTGKRQSTRGPLCCYGQCPS
ncbi:PHD finger protein 7-like [Accipiter gentilis]|uniref:PHD finger protein 7-like n=1 Tax=Astur gentilis TaxID=8957 RepID=UPI00210F511F|nr:PHD finger protein 7-like [Accipiter gentilis]